MKRSLEMALTLVLGITLFSCGGDGNDAATPTPPTPTPTTSKVGDATITKTLQPNVIQLEPNQASATSKSELVINNPPTAIKAGSVITWNDSAYVIESINTDSNGVIHVSTRTAEFNEVFSDLVVVGDLQSADFDFTRMGLAIADSSAKQANGSVAMQKMTTYAAGPCTADVGEPSLGESTTASCTVKIPYQSFSFNIKAGFKDALLTGVDIRYLQAKFSVDKMKITPFSRVDLAMIGTDNKPTTIGKSDLPIVYFQVPVKETAGFLRLDIPLRLDFSLPLFQFNAGVEVAFPYSSADGWSMTPSIDTPVATIGGGQVFKYEAKPHFYAVAGAELVLAKSLVLAPNVQWFQANSPDRLFSVGALFKGGVDGSFSVKIDDLQTKPCFNWSLQGVGGAASDIKIGTDRLNTLGALAMKNFGPPITGSSGCESMGFWSGTAQITDCTIKYNTVCNFLTFNLNLPEVAGLAFRTGNESLNLRLDQQYGCVGATTVIPEDPVVGTTWSYTLNSSSPYASGYPFTTTYSVTNRSANSISGTLIVSFSGGYLGDGLGNTPAGTATGVWSVQKRDMSFPKCLSPSPSTAYTSNTPSFFCSNFNVTDDPYGCDFESIGFEGRKDEWQVR
ncbi:hypothetical protein [Aeromonas veronii]|uniref:hypothetical protein n=1 Tax=Aeromonas veronii TaxID=654 RepID=UPI003D206529